MSDLIKELEDRVAVKRMELEEDERALQRVRRMMGLSSVSTPTPQDEKELLGTVDFNELLGSVQKNRKRTLLDDVRNVVSKFEDNEFSVPLVEAVLHKLGVSIDGKSPRASLSLALAKLVDEGVIKRVFVGKGNIPHRYKYVVSHDLV